jgi:hypothetical protein
MGTGAKRLSSRKRHADIFYVTKIVPPLIVGFAGAFGDISSRSERGET